MESDDERYARYRKTLVEIVQKTIPHCKIYLFGSRARKTHRPGADIDLALDAGHVIDLDTILSLYSQIEQTTIPLEIDLVDIHAVSSEMLQQIESEKVRWAA